MRLITIILIAVTLGAATGEGARIPALEEDSLYLGQIERRENRDPGIYVWVASACGPMYASERSDIGGWLLSSFSVSASTRKGWLMTLRFPEVGFPPPALLSASDASPVQQDSLLGFSILAGRRKRWRHGHISLAAGLNHAQGVRIQSHDTCASFFRGCEQIVDRKEPFREFGPVLEIEALTGWRYFGVGAGIEVLGTRHQAWGWHFQFVGGRVF
jgi:hypothetical protein